MTKQLITKGDDLGAAHSFNRGIHDAFKQGILRNAGIIVPGPYVEEAAALLAHEEGMCFGLHATVTSEWDSLRWGPVLPPERVPSLVDDNGLFFQTTVELWHQGAKVDAIMMELQAQVERARELGFDLRYLDFHMGGVWIVNQRGDETVFPRFAADNGLIYTATVPMQRLRIRKGGGDGADDPIAALIAVLDAAGPGLYGIGGHPAYDTEEMRGLGHEGYPGDTVARNTSLEREQYMDPRMIEYCRTHGVEPVRFDQVAQPVAVAAS